MKPARLPGAHAQDRRDAEQFVDLEPKQILVVDDHYEILEFLRSMLELAAGDVSVAAVPSGEEGWLEILRAPVDLVITDLRLPGMDGFELVRRVRRRVADLPIIMITGNPTDDAQSEAAALGISYFEKPLDTEEILGAVQKALGRPPAAAPRLPKAQVADLPPAAAHRLENLLTEARPRELLLADAAGNILYHTGEPSGIDLNQLAQTFAATQRQGEDLAAQLGRPEPSSIQYHAGDRMDLYGAAVGHRYFILALFEEQSRRARFATVWLFFQRAVRDLLSIFDEAARVASLPPVPRPGATRPLSLVGLAAELSPDARRAGAAVVGEDENAVGGTAEVVPHAEEAPVDDALLAELLGLELPETADVDIEAYWETAIDEAESEAGVLPGLSIEEALRNGLLPSQFDSEAE